MPTASEELRASFRLAMRRFPAAVSVITSADQTRQHGMTATAVTSLSLDPPSLIVCVNRSTLLHDIILQGRHFCVNILRKDQAELSSAFGGAVAPEARFGCGNWLMSAQGVSYLADAQANIFCRKVAAVPYSTFLIPREDIFYSIVTRDVVPDPSWRGFVFHFRPGHAEEEKLARAVALLGVTRADLADVAERRTVLPSPVLGHHELIAGLEDVVDVTALDEFRGDRR